MEKLWGRERRAPFPLKGPYSASKDWSPHLSLAANNDIQVMSHRCVTKWGVLGAGQPPGPATAADLVG